MNNYLPNPALASKWQNLANVLFISWIMGELGAYFAFENFWPLEQGKFRNFSEQAVF